MPAIGGGSKAWEGIGLTNHEQKTKKTRKKESILLGHRVLLLGNLFESRSLLFWEPLGASCILRFISIVCIVRTEAHRRVQPQHV